MYMMRVCTPVFGSHVIDFGFQCAGVSLPQNEALVVKTIAVLRHEPGARSGLSQRAIWYRSALSSGAEAKAT